MRNLLVDLCLYLLHLEAPGKHHLTQHVLPTGGCVGWLVVGILVVGGDIGWGGCVCEYCVCELSYGNQPHLSTHHPHHPHYTSITPPISPSSPPHTCIRLKCPLNVDSEASRLCSSPTSASTDDTGGNRMGCCAGTGIPHWAMSTARPTACV